MLEDQLGHLVKACKDGVLYDSESRLRDVSNISFCLDECFRHLIMVFLDCDAEGGLSFGRDNLNNRTMSDQQLNNGQVAVMCRPHERSVLGLLDQRIIDYSRVFLEDFLHILDLILLDVIVE